MGAPEIGSRWREIDARRPHIAVPDLTVRVIVVAEGYVMARFKGSAPFLTHTSDWPKRFEPQPKDTTK